MYLYRTGNFILFLIVFSTLRLSAEKYYAVTSAIENIYQSVWEMDYIKAYEAVEEAKSDDPNNLLIYHVENYIDFTRIFLTDDVRYLESFLLDVNKRIDLIKTGDSSSPYFYFSQAEIYIQRSLVRSKNGEEIKAGWDINRAHKLLKKCKKEHPDFMYSDKSLSVIHMLMGSMKGIKKTLIKLFTSLEGTVEQGIEEISNLYNWNKNNPSIWSDEIITVQSLIYGHLEKKWPEAFKTIQEIDDYKKLTPLGRFLIGSTAYHTGENDHVIAILSEEDHDHSFYYLDLLAGTALLNKGDTSANIYFQRYLDNHHGSKFLKSACHKLAWYELTVRNNIQGYDQWMGRCKFIGDSSTGEDQEAQRSCETKERPNKHLLKSRLLFDGGYYKHALIEVQKYNPSSKSETHNIEYTYRKARILQQLGESKEALVLLDETINLGRTNKEYYACNAALQMAYIFYQKNDYKSAKRYAELVLDIHPKERKESLHNEAKI